MFFWCGRLAPRHIAKVCGRFAPRHIAMEIQFTNNENKLINIYMYIYIYI